MDAGELDTGPGSVGPFVGREAETAVSGRTRGRRGRPRAGWHSLTPTEREVVAQVATGLSNAEIGARLLISPGTVRTHLRSVFAKLGVSSRADLAARTVRDQDDGTGAPAVRET